MGGRSSIPGAEQKDAPWPGVRVKAACRQVSKLTWPAPASLHSSLPCVPIKLHFKLLLGGGGLGPGSTYGAGLGACPHRGEHGHKLGACGVGVVQSPGWILEGPEEGPGAPGAATRQTGCLRPDTGGIPAVYMYICMYFPLTGCHLISRKVEQKNIPFGCSDSQDYIACMLTLFYQLIRKASKQTCQTRTQCPLHRPI